MPEILTSIDIKAPIARVWDALTRPGMCRPMFETVFHRTLEPGKPFRYSCADGKRTFVFGEFVEVDPPRRLVHTFHSTFDKGRSGETLVTWTLEELSPGSTRVTLRHEGFAADDKGYRGVTKGWLDILNLFRHEIETGRIPLRTRVRNRLMSLTTFMLPAATLTERLEPKYRSVR